MLDGFQKHQYLQTIVSSCMVKTIISTAGTRIFLSFFKVYTHCLWGKKRKKKGEEYWSTCGYICADILCQTGDDFRDPYFFSMFIYRHTSIVSMMKDPKKSRPDPKRSMAGLTTATQSVQSLVATSVTEKGSQPEGKSARQLSIVTESIIHTPDFNRASELF